MIAEKAPQFLDQFTQWTAGQADILALALVGSHARGAATDTSDERWAALPADEGTRQVMQAGMRVLFERGDLLSRHLGNGK
jgi:hypothetical protein